MRDEASEDSGKHSNRRSAMRNEKIGDKQGRQLKRKLSRMGRRGFMKTLATVGVSSATLTYGTQAGLADTSQNPKDEIPYVAYLEVESKNPGEPPVREPIYETISRDEWAPRRATYKVRDKIGNILITSDGYRKLPLSVRGMGRSPTGFGVEVHVPTSSGEAGSFFPDIDFSDLRGELPDKINATVARGEYSEEYHGIPIQISETSFNAVQCLDCQGDTNWSNVPGGTPIEVVTGSSEPNIDGSITGSFHHPSYGRGWVTAGHVVDEKTGKTVKQSGDEIGVSRVAYDDGLDIDYAFIEPSSSEDVTSYLSDNSNNSYAEPITGIVTRETLDNNVDNQDYRVKTQGRTTCRQDGYIRENFAIPGTATSAVGTSQDADPGDSGGPLFHIDGDGDAKIAGNMIQEYGPDDSGFDNCGSHEYTKSTIAEKVESSMGGYYF